MTDPKPALTPVRLVDEGYIAPAGASAIEKRNGEIAAAKREGRAKEKAAQAIARAEQAAQHQGEVAGIQTAHTAEIARLDERWAREERKHGSGRFWSGVSTGVMVMLAIGSVVAAVYTTQVMNASFDAAGEASARRDALEIVREAAERPPTTNEPRSESAP